MEIKKVPMSQANVMAAGNAVLTPMAEPAGEEPTMLQTIDDVMRRENTVWSYLEAQRFRYEGATEVGYNPFEDLPDEYWAMSDMFRGARSREHRDLLIAQANSEMKRADRISRAGAGKYAWGLLAALGSPEMAPMLIMNPLRGVGSAMQSAVRLGALGAAETAVMEANLQRTQQTRSWKESLVTIGGAGLLTFAMGGALGKMALSKQTRYMNRVDEDIRGIAEDDSIDVVPDGVGGSAGAAATIGSLTDEAPINKPWIRSGNFTIFHGLAHATSPEVHRAMNKFFRTTLSLGKNRKVVDVPQADGSMAKETRWIEKEPSVENAVLLEENALIVRSKHGIWDNYATYAGKSGKFAYQRAVLGGMMKQNKSLNQFEREIATSIRTGIESSDDAVKAAAAEQNAVLDELAALAQKFDELPEDLQVRFSEGYFPRRYNRLGIRGNRGKSYGVLREHYAPEWVETARARLVSTAKKSLKRARDKGPEGIEQSYREIQERVTRAEADPEFDARIAADRQKLIDEGRQAEADEMLDLKGIKKQRNVIEKQRRDIKRQAKDSSELEANIRKTEGRLKRSKKPETVKAIKKELAGMRKRMREIKAARKAKTDEIARLKEAVKAAKTNEVKLTKEEEAELDVAIDRTIERILNGEIGEPVYRPAKVGSAFKERVNSVPDAALHEAGMLLDTVDDIMQSHIRSTLRPLRMIEAAGDSEMKTVLADVAESYRTRRLAAVQAGDDKLADEINDEMITMLDLLTVARDRYYMRSGSSYATDTNAQLGILSRVLRRYNLVTGLGGVMFTSLADPTRLLLAGSMRALMSPTHPTFRKALKTANYNRKTYQKAGFAAETATRSRLAAIADIDETGQHLSKVDEWTRRRANEFMGVTGLNHWTDFAKRWSAAAAQDNMVYEFANYGALKSSRKQFIAEQGFSPEDAVSFNKMFKEHGETLDWGGTALNWDDWTDQVLAKKVKEAIFRESETFVVTPGVLDRPVWADGDVARMMLQFRSFSIAAHNQVTNRMWDRGRAGEMLPMTRLLAVNWMAGVIVDVIKMANAGRLDEVENYSTMDWVLAGLDRGGAVPMLMEAFNTIDLVNKNAITSAMGAYPVARYSDRNRLSVFGPTMNKLGDLVDIGGAFVDGKVDDRDIRLARRLMPYNNLVWTRRLAREVEEMLYTGKKGRKRREK